MDPVVETVGLRVEGWQHGRGGGCLLIVLHFYQMWCEHHFAPRILSLDFNVVPCFVKCSNMDVHHFLLPIRYQIYVKAGKIVQHFLCHINTSRESLKPAECRHIKGNEMTRLLSRCRSQPNKRPGRTETKDQILSTRINPTASVVFEEKVNNVSHLCVSRFWGERSRCGARNSPSTLPTLISSMLEIWC